MSLSNDHCKELLRSLPEAVLIVNQGGKILDLNEPACSLFNYSKKQIEGRGIEELFPEVEKSLSDPAEGNVTTVKSLESVVVTRDGEEIPVEVKGREIEVDGELRVLFSVRDISDRKSTRKKYQAIAEGSSQAIYLFQDGEFNYVNDSFEKITGYTRKELRNIGFLELVHPEYREKIGKWTKNALAGRADNLPKKVEYKIVTKEGETLWIRSVPSLTEYQGETAIASNAIDITEEKSLKKQLKQSKERYQRYFEQLGDAIFITKVTGENHGRILSVNSTATKQTGYSREELVGMNIEDDLAIKDPEPFTYEEGNKRLLRGETINFTEKKKKKNGDIYWTEVVVTRIDYEGKDAALSINRDITERKEAEKELKNNQEKLTELHKAIDQLHSCTSEKELCRKTVRLAENILEFELCALDLLEEDVLVPKATSIGLPEDDARRQRVGDGLGGKTIEKCKTYWGGDVRNCEIATPSREDFRAYISVPIGELGIIQVVSTEKDAFTGQDVELMEILADHLRAEINRVRLEDELKEQAIRDPLTGLYNRRYFNETLQKEAEKAERYNNPIAFLMADVDQFKEINDRYSHQTGDRVLQKLSKILLNNVRSADTAVRYGGDEFLIMMPETNGEVKRIIDRLKQELADWNERNSLIDFPLTIAMGVSHWNPGQDRDLEAALKEADRKMYRDKDQ